MEQLKKTLLKTSQSLDDIPVLIKEHLKKSKTKSSSLISNKDEQKQNKDNKDIKDNKDKAFKYDIIATSVVNDADGLSDSNDDSSNDLEELPFNIKKLQKDNNKQKSEPNLTSNGLYNLNSNIIIDKKNIIENNEKKTNYLVINPESSINEIPKKSYIDDNNSSNNTQSKNISFSTHYKNSSECSNNGKGFGDNGENGRFMEDDNNYKENNNYIDEKRTKENQVIIEEISAEKFFEYLNSSNISKINENNTELKNNKNPIYNILIFDFRLHEDFENEYISKSINVNIPLLILNRSLKHHYTNSFNIQKFVFEKDKAEIEKWILNNYKINNNKNLNTITKPLIIVYDDQNIMDVDISISPVKTFIKYLEVQHIIALNELSFSLLTEQSDSSSNSQSIVSQENKHDDLAEYLLNKPLNIAWVTGGYDAICNHSESSNYILNNKNDYNKNYVSKSNDNDVCLTPLEAKPTLNIDNNSNAMECSTPIEGKPPNFNSVINNNIKDYNNNKPNFHLDMLNKKSNNQKQKLTLNISCAINNCSDECKTPLSAIPNGKENAVNPNYSVEKGLMAKKYNNISTPQLDDDDKPKNIRRKISILSLKTDVGKTDNKLKPQMQPNGMLGVNKNDYNQNCDNNNNFPSKIVDKKLVRVSNCSPSSDLPLNISPTTSTVIPHYTKVLPYLYIGTETIPASSNAIERLKKLKVTHVLNVAMECNVGVTFPEDQIVYKKIDLADNLAENIAKHLWESCEWIG